MSILQSMRVQSDKLILMISALAIAICFIMYFVGDGERRYVLHYPLETSLSGFTKHHPERRIIEIFPVEICINRVTEKYLECRWAIVTKLKQSRISEYIQTDWIASLADQK